MSDGRGGDEISSEDEEERAVGDDRYKFCNKSIWLGYFWCVSDQLGLTQEVCSNVSRIGASSTAGRFAITSKIKTHQNTATKRKSRATNEIAEIKGAIEGMQKASAASRTVNQLNERVFVCRDALTAANETLQSA